MRGMAGSCGGSSGFGVLNKFALLALLLVSMSFLAGCQKSKANPYEPPPCGYCEILDEATQTCVWNCGDGDRPDSDSDSDGELDTDKPEDADDGDSADSDSLDGDENDGADGDLPQDGDLGDTESCFGGECDFDHEFEHCECQQDTDCGANETCGADCQCHNKCQCQNDFDCVNEAYTCGTDCLCHLKVDGDQDESACTPCRSHADCGNGAFCRPIAVPDDEAEGDGDTAGEGDGEENDEPIGCCDATYRAPCLTNKNCPYAPLGTASYCDPQAGFCTFDCKTSSDCDDTQCCNCHGECVAIDECQCAETVDGDLDMNCNGCEDCSGRGAGYYCNSLTGLCTAGGQCCKASDCPSDHICNTQNGECMPVVPPKQGSISGTINALKEMAGYAFEVLLLDAPYPNGSILARSGGLYLQVNGDISSVAYSLTGLSEDNYYAYVRSVASASSQFDYTYNPIAVSFNSPAQQYRTGINFYLYVENPSKAGIQGTIHLAPQYAANSVQLTLWYESTTGLVLAGDAVNTAPTSGDTQNRSFEFFNVTDTGSRAYYYLEARMAYGDTDLFDWYSSPIEIKDLAKNPGYKSTGNDIYFGDEVENSDLGSLQGTVFLNGYFDWGWTIDVYLYTTSEYLYPVAQAKMNGNPFTGYSYRFSNIEGLHFMDGSSGIMTYYVRAVAKNISDGTTYYGLPAEGYEYFDVEEGPGVANDYSRNLTISQPPTGR